MKTRTVRADDGEVVALKTTEAVGQRAVRALHQATRKWGVDFNLNMVEEEVAELVAAHNRWLRGRIDEKELACEVADVLIVTTHAAMLGSEQRLTYGIEMIRAQHHLKHRHQSIDMYFLLIRKNAGGVISGLASPLGDRDKLEAIMPNVCAIWAACLPVGPRLTGFDEELLSKIKRLEERTSTHAEG